MSNFRKPFGPGWSLVGDAGVLSPADFLSDDNVGRIMAAVG